MVKGNVSVTAERERESQVTRTEKKKTAPPAATGSQQLGWKLQVRALQVALFNRMHLNNHKKKKKFTGLHFLFPGKRIKSARGLVWEPNPYR